MKGNPLRLFRLLDAGWPLPLGSLHRPLARPLQSATSHGRVRG